MRLQHIQTLFFFATLLVASCSGSAQVKEEEDGNGNTEKTAAAVGEPLPAWVEGQLDIHFISTGRGECAFYILPDGTTMVVDAGEIFPTGSSKQPQRPDAKTRAYKTHINYIKHFLPASAGGKLDYAMLTHFHIDHMGEMDAANEIHAQGQYQICGLSGLYQEVPFRKIIDRAYPTYSGDNTIFATDESKSTVNYIKFVEYIVAHDGVSAERFKVGTDEQLVLTGADKGKYTNFSIFNHVGNGYCYYKKESGESVIKGKIPGSENGASCGFHLKYGDFDFIAAGDLVSYAQNLQAYYNRDYVHNLEAFKSNHHLNANSWGSQMRECNFNPKVIVVPCFDEEHAHPDIMSYLTQQPWPKDIFLTKDWDASMEANKALYSKCAGYGGHFVIRVSPGGKQFHVYKLRDTDFSFTVEATYGPYNCL